MRVVHTQDVGKFFILIPVPLFQIHRTQGVFNLFWLCLTAQH